VNIIQRLQYLLLSLWCVLNVFGYDLDFGLWLLLLRFGGRGGVQLLLLLLELAKFIGLGTLFGNYMEKRGQLNSLNVKDRVQSWK
jgi:hypothetical protein